MATYNDEIAIEIAMDSEGYISGEVYIDLDDIIRLDLEGFLDLLSEQLIGSCLLMDINYKISKVDSDGMLVFVVHGDPSMALDDT